MMVWDLGQLEALETAVREGTFEAAARALHVTPSAISQRLRALETSTGQVLLVRSKPVRATPAGETVLRLARQVALLGSEAAAALGSDSGSGDATPASRSRGPTLAVAVNADSLATWVLPALAPLAGDLFFHLLREDEGRTADLLRDGSVVAAITTDADPIAGCTVTHLGSMRYHPVAAPGFVARWFAGGASQDALAQAPVVVFDRDDPLQRDYLVRHATPSADPPAHMIPSSADYARAIGLGLGWGMLPAQQIASAPAGSLLEITPGGHVDVPLHWQQWRLRSPALERLTAAIVAAARAELHP